VFGLEQFERVILIDADMIFLRGMDELFDLELKDGWIGAAPACVCNPFKIADYPTDWYVHTIQDPATIICSSCARSPWQGTECDVLIYQGPRKLRSVTPRDLLHPHLAPYTNIRSAPHRTPLELWHGRHPEPQPSGPGRAD
jgi:hypothetical protein